MTTLTLGRRSAIASCFFAWIVAGAALHAAPLWYANGTGGFNPNLPDFYQHQNWVKGAPADNNWQRTGGWCFQIAYADVFYDLTKQGYLDLLPADVVLPAKWFDTVYKPADVNNSGISKMRSEMTGTIQAYLDAKGHKVDDPLPLLANTFKVKADGKISYRTPALRVGDADLVEPLFSFYDLKTKAGDSLTLKLLQGGADLRPDNKTQGLWWNFHQVAGAGLDVASKTIFIADPDTNRGSKLEHAGWPSGLPAGRFPGDPPAAAGGSFGLKTISTDPIPIPGAPAIGAIATYNTFYAGFTLNDANKVTGDADNARYTKTIVSEVQTISAPKAKGILFDGLPGGPGKTVVAVNPLGFGATGIVNLVDKVFIAPSTAVLDQTTNPSMFSFTIDSDPSSTWTTTVTSFDPLGNELLYRGVQFDWTSGGLLGAAGPATASLGTILDFLPTGYEILLHYAGDPSTTWNPEVIGSLLNQGGLSQDQLELVPEPSAALLSLCGWLAFYFRGRALRSGKLPMT